MMMTMTMRKNVDHEHHDQHDHHDDDNEDNDNTIEESQNLPVPSSSSRMGRSRWVCTLSSFPRNHGQDRRHSQRQRSKSSSSHSQQQQQQQQQQQRRSWIVIMMISVLALAALVATIWSTSSCRFVHQHLSQYLIRGDGSGGRDGGGGGRGGGVHHFETYGLPRSVCLIKPDFYEWRLPPAVETSRARTLRVEYQQQQQQQQQQQEQQQQQRPPSTPPPLIRNRFVDPPDWDKTTKRTFQRAQNQANKAWQLGLMSWIVLWMLWIPKTSWIMMMKKTKQQQNVPGATGTAVEVEVEAAVVDEQDEEDDDVKNIDDNSPFMSTLLCQDWSPLSFARWMQLFRRSFQWLILAMQRRPLMVLTITGVGFCGAALASVASVRIAVWQHTTFCRKQCASDIVLAQQRQMQQIQQQQQQHMRAPALAHMMTTTTTTTTSEQQQWLEVDACIEGCDLASGGHAALVAVGLWSLCAVLTFGYLVCIGRGGGGRSSRHGGHGGGGIWLQLRQRIRITNTASRREQ